MRRRSLQDGVELNLAAMLDMAFQLLAFFILTFKPSPVEGEVQLRLPPPQPVTRSGQGAGSDSAVFTLPPDVELLVVRVTATADGKIGALVLGERQVKGLGDLASILNSLLSDRVAGFDQIEIQASPGLLYEELMRVMDVCAQQRLADGSRLSKISLVEMPEDEPDAAAP
jgi:biopolymer transport protein ExbD